MTHKFEIVDLVVVPKEIAHVTIDKKIIPLVMALCDLGWTTCHSCQDNEGRVWLCFSNSSSAVSFLELIASKSDNLRGCVLNSITQEYEKWPNILEYPNRWWVDSFTHCWYDNHQDWIGRISIEVSIRFPKEHLKEVTTIVVDKRDMLNQEGRL